MHISSPDTVQPEIKKRGEMFLLWLKRIQIEMFQFTKIVRIYEVLAITGSSLTFVYAADA